MCRRAGNQYLVDYGVVDFPLRFLHKGFPYAERTLVSSEFLGEHFALLRLAVYHIQHIHRAVADVGNQINAFQRSGKARNSGIPLRIDAYIVDIEVVISPFCR